LDADPGSHEEEVVHVVADFVGEVEEAEGFGWSGRIMAMSGSFGRSTKRVEVNGSIRGGGIKVDQKM
jgi:hypothetical protein